MLAIEEKVIIFETSGESKILSNLKDKVKICLDNILINKKGEISALQNDKNGFYLLSVCGGLN